MHIFITSKVNKNSASQQIWQKCIRKDRKLIIRLEYGVAKLQNKYLFGIRDMISK